MEKWQIDHIQNNLTSLVNCTDCHDDIKEALVNDGVFTEDEVESLDITRRYEGRAKESWWLYHNLQTKVNGYTSLTKTLFQNGQTEATEILLQGFRQQGHKDAFQKCQIQIDYEKVFSTVVSFQGHEIQIRKILEKLHLNDEQFLKDAFAENDYFEIFVSQNKTFELVRNTLPKKHSVYIPRKLCSSLCGTTYSEDEFLARLITEKSTQCIVGELGSGRSFLLANLARYLSKMSKDNLVVFTSLPDFIENFSEPEEIIPDLVMKHIMKCLCSNSLSEAILTKLLQKRIVNLTLMIDGLDEVQSNSTSLANSFLNAIPNLPIDVKTIVTTNQNFIPELDNINMEIYFIVPFHLSDKISLLSKHWQNALQLQDEISLQKFAIICLEKVGIAVDPTTNFKIGSPLQCFLLAKMLWKEAKLFVEQENNQKKSDSILMDEEISIFTLYQRFFTPSRKITHTIDDIKIRNRKSLFRLKALEQVFPGTAEIYAQYAKIFGKSNVNLVEMGKHPKGHHQIHQTFSQYLISELFTDLLLNRTLSVYKHLEFQENLIQYLVKDILTSGNVSEVRTNLELYSPLKAKIPNLKPVEIYTFQQTGIAYFLNEQLKSRQINSYDYFIVTDFFASITPQNMNQILQSCLAGGYTHIIRLIMDLLTKVPDKQLQAYKTYLTAETSTLETQATLIRRATLLSIAATHSYVMIEEICTLFSKCFQVNLIEICEYLPLWANTPLHVVVQKPDIRLVKYFINKISLNNRSLLYYCVHKSYKDGKQTVQKRVAICRLLLDKNPNLIQEESFESNGESVGSPLLASEIHFELLQYLIQIGADVEATHAKENVVHKTVKYMTPQDFHKFCRFLLQVQKAISLFTRNDMKWKRPIHYILENGKDLEVETIQLLLRYLEVDVNEEDEKGNNLILSAVLGNQTIFVIMVLIEQGADINKKNSLGQGLLHLACKNGNLELVQYFLLCGLSLEDPDASGKTPLLLASFSRKTVRYLLEKGVDFNAKDNNGNTLAHLAAENMNETDFALMLEYSKVNGEYGKIFTFKNEDGRTPKDLLIMHGKGVPKLLDLEHV